jgi:hypothetical protein
VATDWLLEGRTVCFGRASATAQLEAALSALEVLDALLPMLAKIPAALVARKCAELSSLLARLIATELPWIETNALPQSILSNFREGCDAALERRTILATINTDVELHNLLKDDFTGIDTNIDAALNALTFGKGLERHELPDQVVAQLKASHPLEAAQRISTALTKLMEGLTKVKGFSAELSALGAFELDTWVGAPSDGDLDSFPAALGERMQVCTNRVDDLVPWSLYLARRREAVELGLGEFAELLEGRHLPPGDLAPAYRYCTYATIVREAFRRTPQLGRFSGLKHHQIRREFQRLDREIIEIRGMAVAASVHQNTPQSAKMGLAWLIGQRWFSWAC